MKRGGRERGAGSGGRKPSGSKAARQASRTAAKAKQRAAAGKPAAPKPPNQKPASHKSTEQKPAAQETVRTTRARSAAAMRKSPGPEFPTGLLGVLKYDEPLGRHTTFRIGGPARWHFTPGDRDSLLAAVAWARQNGLPWMVLGLGSNVLIRDGGFKGLVIKIGKGLDELVQKGQLWTAGAGLATPLLARRTAEAGFAGVQRLIGVPGTVGGGVFMNAGCHGQEMAKVLTSATLLTPAGQIVERARKDIPFSYRRSGLEGFVVLGCTVRLEPAKAADVKEDYLLYLKKRREGTPFDQPCCGSVFKNPADATAGKLIERCALKGRRVGGAEISMQHANYIVNRGGARAEDVLKLIDIARTAVFKEYGIELELEVKVIGDPA